MNLISSGRAYRLTGISEDREKSMLVKLIRGKQIPIAQLVSVNDISIILPLTEDTKFSSPNLNIVAPVIIKPAVAKLKKCSSADRWHQRLGHVGPLILSKTKNFAKGLGGIDTSELTHCEACHLSKAQRTVSREKRPIPFEPLDEAFVDMVGPLQPNIFGHRYAVIITDATTRMRWWFAAKTKDTIPGQLIDWVNSMENQCGKTLRVCFSDGGSEIQQNSKWQELAREKGIRQDISASYTPEQNGLAEAANKVVITRARCLLIDAGMPVIFWFWAVSHSIFITNHLYNLSSNNVPVLHFHHSLKLAHHKLLDFTCLPRFGCKAYRTLNKPEKGGKFDPRAQIGWFIGFQCNTNKNALIISPPKTPQHCWAWKVFCTPHASFYENCMYGPTMAELNRLSPQQYHSGGGLGFDHPAATENDLTPDLPTIVPSEPLSTSPEAINTDLNLLHDSSSSSLREEETSTQQPQPQESANEHGGSDENHSHDEEQPST
ncbi:hypothetical protein K3495_g15272, partial [Podosphaera aphanis]